MPQITPSKLQQHLSKRAPSAVFYFSGEEEHLREEAVQRAVEAYLEPATRDFNLDQLRGADVPAEHLASLLATPPMMAEHRVVVVRDAQGLSMKAREVVEGVAASPPAGLVLVLSASVPGGSKARFYDVLKKHALAVEYGAVGINDLPGVLIERAREAHGVELEVDAARALVTAIGGQLGILFAELEKLASYVGGSGVVDREAVKAVGGYLPRVDRWEWFELVSERRLDRALRLLPELLETGESGVGLVIGITGQLLRVGIAVAGGREALERELPPRQRFLAQRVLGAARHWTLAEVDVALEELLRTDRLLKTASLTDRQAIEELLLRLMTRLAGRDAA